MMFNRARRTIRFALTLLLIAFAAFAVVGLWDHYMVSPWTRDGQVRVQVADIAPQVPGQVVELLVQDNQFVHKGDLLYVIDKGDYKVPLDLAKADVEIPLRPKRGKLTSIQALRNGQKSEAPRFFLG
jgi:multidrug resistance efflux pump